MQVSVAHDDMTLVFLRFLFRSTWIGRYSSSGSIDFVTVAYYINFIGVSGVNEFFSLYLCQYNYLAKCEQILSCMHMSEEEGKQFRGKCINLSDTCYR